MRTKLPDRVTQVAMFVSLCLISNMALAEDPPAPTVDTVLQELLTLDPAQLALHVKDLKSRAVSLDAESQALRTQAAELEKQIDALKANLGPFLDLLKALADAEGLTAPPAPENTAMAGTEVEPASLSAPNFVDHVLPILEARCLRCHNEDKQKGGLMMSNFEAALEGGSSGEVILPGDPDGSRIMTLVMQLEDPIMPPKGDPLAEAQIAVIRAWIAAGALPNSGAKAMVAQTESSVSNEPAFVAAAMSDGPPPMPEVQLAPAKEITHQGIVARAIATSPTAPLAAVGGDKQIVLYDLEKLRLLGALPFDEGDIFTMSFSVNGEILLAGGGEEGHSGRVVLWNVREGRRLGEFGKGYDTVLAGDISPDHRMVAVGGPNRVVRVYSTQDGTVLYKIDNHTDWIYSVKFSPDGELLATADRAGNLYLWQAANGRAVESLRGHNGAIHDMAYTYDSNVLATAGADGSVILWDTWKYKQTRKIAAHSGAVLALDFSDAGQLVTAGIDGQTKRWGLDGKNIGAFEALPDWAYQTRFGSKDSVVLSGDWRGGIAVWNAETGARVADLTTNPAADMVVATADSAPPAQ